MTSGRRRWAFLVFVVGMGVSLLALGRAQSYYGTIYRGWDAQFYYALARSLVFDRDVDVTNDLRATPVPQPFDPDRDGSFRRAPRHPDGHIWSKYPIGLSLVEAPLVATGALARRVAEVLGVVRAAPAGYSDVELWTVAVGLIAVFAAGLATLYRLLADEWGDGAAAVAVAGAWAGTSLFYYSAVFPFMAHALSFVLLVAIMALARGLDAVDDLNRRLVLLGASLGALFLVRPQQAVIAVFLCPVVVRACRIRTVAGWAPGTIGAAALALAAVGAQVAFNASQTGMATPNGYAAAGEGFGWLSPDLGQVLLGESRGLIVFSPVVLLAAAGYAFCRGSLGGYAWAAAANAIAQIYVIAAWSSPEQGDAFGARMWSDNAAAVAVGLALLFDRASRIGRWAVTGAVAAAVAWSVALLVRYVTGG